MRAILRSAAFLVGVVWAACTLVVLYAPDLVTGSQHEHLPLASFTVWLWALVATGYVLMGARRWVAPGFVAGVLLVWAAVVLVAAFAPVMVTGTDPTQIPMAALMAPVFGTLATGFLALHNANGAEDQRTTDVSPAVSAQGSATDKGSVPASSA